MSLAYRGFQICEQYERKERTREIYNCFFRVTGADSGSDLLIMKSIVGLLAKFTIMQAPRQGVCHYNPKISLPHYSSSVVSQILYSTVCNKLAWFESDNLR